jgi:DNA polymerase/3'-5' exonuclease PolX
MTQPPWNLEQAQAVADELYALLLPVCQKLVVVGDIRRRAPLVSEVVIHYISRSEPRDVPGDMFRTYHADLAKEALESALSNGVLAEIRPGQWNPALKRATHVQSGIPVVLHQIPDNAWESMLVYATGPETLCARIKTAAMIQGWTWRPIEGCLSKPNPNGAEIKLRIESERHLFDAVKMPYVEPEGR